MASAAEQLAANLNFGAFAKAEDLKRRIWFTLGALIVYRLGTYIPVPGVDPVELSRLVQQNSTGILGWINGLAGGALEALPVALALAPPVGQLEAESSRLGVDAMGAADHRRVLELVGALLERVGEPRQAFGEEFVGVG